MSGASWCYRRAYEEEREREKASCVFLALESEREDPLFVDHRLGSPAKEAKEEKGAAVSPAATAEESAGEASADAGAGSDAGAASTKANANARGRSASQLVQMEDDDFDPLGATNASAADGGGVAGSADDDDDDDPLMGGGAKAKRTAGAAVAAAASQDRAGSGPGSGSGADGAGEGGDYWERGNYLPGLERKSNWQDWRDTRSQLLNIKSFLDKSHLAKDESLSVVTVNLNFQVVGTTSLQQEGASGGAGGAGDSAAAARLQALEDAIEQKHRERRDRRQTATSSVQVRQQILSDQQDMVKRLSLLNQDLSTAWAKNQRVVAVKIAERTAHLLEKQANSMQIAKGSEATEATGAMAGASLQDGVLITSLVFYPALFTFACEILDTLGSLVWDRIKRKCQYVAPPPPTPLTPTHSPFPPPSFTPSRDQEECERRVQVTGK